MRHGLTHEGQGFTVSRWLEHVESPLHAELCLDDGRGIVFANRNLRYLAAWPDEALLERLMTNMADEAKLPTTPLPCDVRLRRAGTLRFAFNYGASQVELHDLAEGADMMIGSAVLPPAGVAVWRA